MFEFGMTPTINKPTRVTKCTALAKDNITNCTFNPICTGGAQICAPYEKLPGL